MRPLDTVSAAWRDRTPVTSSAPVLSLIACAAVQVFAWVRLREATTAPIVGDIVSVPSTLRTEVTAKASDA